MIEQTRDDIDYYYDSHPTEEDLMGGSLLHAELMDYLKSVLVWLFREKVCAIYKNFNFYRTSDKNEYPLAPDLAVIKGVPRGPIRSWRVGIHGPAPHVVFEIASEKTWERDLTEKPGAYAALGVQEYYAYDPNEPPLYESRREGQQLFGWRREQSTGLLRRLPLQSDGKLWSPHLDSFLVPDGAFLRLYDRSRRPRLTEAEAEADARGTAMRLAESESAAKRRAMRLAEVEAYRADIEAEKARTYAEKLRSLGIDPEQLI